MRLAMVPVIVFLITGCGGLNASHSVSPASLFLPGLLKVEPRQPQHDLTVPNPEPVKQVAFAR